ncbi:hypothetical protein Slala03_74370 [Streptomyces lavendulae subsp. lavendulae]|nr:hypothetical protein Slala03_74370 [Streptomyces lavendulae subsp. lavendulae]
MPITRLALPLGDTERPVPDLAFRLAKTLPFIVLPHRLWRLPFAVDFHMGMLDPRPGGPARSSVDSVLRRWAQRAHRGAGSPHPTGLVSRWGEAVPHWVPFLGGRRVAPLAAVIPAALRGPALVAMFDLYPLAWMGGQAPARGAARRRRLTSTGPSRCREPAAICPFGAAEDGEPAEEDGALAVPVAGVVQAGDGAAQDLRGDAGREQVLDGDEEAGAAAEAAELVNGQDALDLWVQARRHRRTADEGLEHRIHPSRKSSP